EGGAAAVLSIAGVTADNDVTVAVTGGDYSDPAVAMDNALAGDKWCVSPTADKPCIAHVAAGFYPSRNFTTPPGVALVGEAKGDTIIGAAVTANGPLVSDLTLTAGLSNFTDSTLSRVERVAATGAFITQNRAVTLSDSDFRTVEIAPHPGRGTVRLVR